MSLATKAVVIFLMSGARINIRLLILKCGLVVEQVADLRIGGVPVLLKKLGIIHIFAAI